MTDSDVKSDRYIRLLNVSGGVRINRVLLYIITHIVFVVSLA